MPNFNTDQARGNASQTSRLGGENHLSGKVSLVGAGPGDPRLLTLRGFQCLQTADVVLYDGLANSEILGFAQSAVCESVGKHGESKIWTQREINARILELARAGKNVVRLKGGDPAVFARSAEELEVLAEAEIPFEVVPGITAALAAASYVGIPITHRDHASAVAFVTGQQRSDQQPQELHWDSLAKFPGTLVFYMGVTTVESWTTSLIDAGKSPDTPSAIIRRCTWQDQSVIRCTLREVAKELTPASKMRPPVIVIVGEVSQLGENFDWFSTKPLHGLGVLHTRPEPDAELTRSLRDLGAEVFHQPAVEVVSPTDISSLDMALEQLIGAAAIEGITFSSINGVDGFMSRLLDRGLDVRALAGCKLACVGASTAEQLTKYGLKADALPDSPQNYSAAGLLKKLEQLPLQDQLWIVTTTNRSQGELQAGLAAAGVKVIEALSYETRPVTKLRPAVSQALSKKRIHACAITSPAIAEATCELLGEHTRDIAPVAFSPMIADKLNQLGWSCEHIAATRNRPGLLATVKNWWLGQHS